MNNERAFRRLTKVEIEKIAFDVVYGGDANIPYRESWCKEVGFPFARAIQDAFERLRSATVIGGRPEAEAPEFHPVAVVEGRAFCVSNPMTTHDPMLGLVRWLDHKMPFAGTRLYTASGTTDAEVEGQATEATKAARPDGKEQ